MDLMRQQSDIFFKFWIKIIDKIQETIFSEGYKLPPTAAEIEKKKANKARMELLK